MNEESFYSKWACAVSLVMLLCFGGCKPPAWLSGQVSCEAYRVELGSIEEIVSGVTSGRVAAEQEAWLGFGGSGGRVARIAVERGAQVDADQELASLGNTEELVRLKNALAELKRLKRSRAVTPSQLDAQHTEVEIAQSLLDDTLIVAPFAGTVIDVMGEVGEIHFGGGQDLGIRLVDDLPRFVEVEIDEIDLLKVKVGGAARVTILAVRRTPFMGRIRRIVNYVQTDREQERTVLIEVDVEAEGRLLPVGASADVELVIEKKDSVPVIPFRAVVGRGDERGVFKISAGKLTKQPIELGLANYRSTEVVKGLSVGDEVVTTCQEVQPEDGQKIEITGYYRLG